MKTFDLVASRRGEDLVGKKPVKGIRKEGRVPAVLYGGEETIHLVIEEEALRNLVYTPNIYLVNLSIDGQMHKAIMKDIQFHPVTDRILHVDFLEVFDAKPIVMSVPVDLDGYAVGVKAGGKLTKDKRYLKVKATYENIPDRLHIDVSSLRLGKTIQVRELSFEGLQLMDAPNAVVCAVRLTRAARGKGMTLAQMEDSAE